MEGGIALQEKMAKLKEPFHPDDIEWRVGSKGKNNTIGLALAYVTNRAIQERLDEVFGIGGWKNEFVEWKGGSQLCGISVKIDNEWITKWDGAADSDFEAVKGGLSNAMKRAACQWGIGRYLYKLPDVWKPIEPVGKSYRLTDIPTLPDWALPAGFNPPPKKESPAPATKESPAPLTVNTLKTQTVKLWDAIAKGKGLSPEQSNEEKKQFVAATLNKKQPQSKADWSKLVSALEKMVG